MLFIQKYTELNWPLETERIQMRGLRGDEKAAVFEIVKHKAVAQGNPWNAPLTIEQFDFSWAEEQAYAHKELAFIEKQTNKIIGTGGLYIDEKNHKARLGYILHPDYWNQGYMTEIVNRLVVLAFNDLKLHRVEASVYSGNIASSRVLEKVGLQYEGRQRDAMYIKHRFVSQDMYGLVRNAWKNQK